jgi:hypothetical protein
MLRLFNICVSGYARSAVLTGTLLSVPISQLPAQPFTLRSQAPDDVPATEKELNADPSDVLSAEEWQRVDAAVDRALSFLAARQSADGSFPTIDMGQPGVTSLCQMAFMSHGHLPATGRYGRHLERSGNYILRCQKPNGLVSVVGPEGSPISRSVGHWVGVAAVYNHAISSLAVSELYGMSSADRAADIKQFVNRSVVATLEMHRWRKARRVDQGGWQYLHADGVEEDSDLSVTGWQLKFLRSARNAGFEVPSEPIDEAVAYVRRCYSKQYGAFGYAADIGDARSRGMAGAGILAFAHAGFHNSPEAQRSGDWLLQYNFDNYNQIEPFTQDWKNDRYHYGVFNSCQGMYQLGGEYWKQFFPRAVKTLLSNQQRDGSWAAESHQYDARFGNCYTTALVVLTLGAPNQLLPIYQR